MRKLVVVLIGLLSVAVPSAAAAQLVGEDLEAIGDELASTGRYVETDSSPELDDAISRANANGVAFASFASDDDAVELAVRLSDQLEGSPYRTALVLTRNGLGASSLTVPDADVDRATAEAFTDFRNGAVSSGIDKFVDSLSGLTTPTTTGSSGAGSDGSTGSGFPLGRILLVGLLGGGAFLLFKRMRANGKAKKQAASDLEADRAEIQEQLRDNADRVLSLGDQVIASGRPELTTSYEQASAAYQEVSMAIDGALLADEIDALDDKIDQAEWQFESIEAQLAGRPVPPSPAEVEAQAAANDEPTPPAPSTSGRRNSERPALGRDESIFETRGSQPRQQPRRRSRGGMGGLGGGLGSVLGSIILGGGGLGGMTGSRRSQRRRGGGMFNQPGGGGVVGQGRSAGGGLGGGVLRRGGSSSRTKTRRPARRRNRSGGSFGSKRRGSGGSF